jgi:lipopolysaccharide export LptBFGC system permease protein LptF
MNGISMKSQIFVAMGVALVASVLVIGLGSTIYAQSNMTGGNMTGGNMTGGNMSMPSAGTSGDDGGDGGGDDGGSDGDGGGDDNDDGENEEGGGNN